MSSRRPTLTRWPDSELGSVHFSDRTGGERMEDDVTVDYDIHDGWSRMTQPHEGQRLPEASTNFNMVLDVVRQFS